MCECQNDGWRKEDAKHIDDYELAGRYMNNPITSAIVFGGLEPLEQFTELYNFIECLRLHCRCNDDVVIYTGYNYDEISNNVEILKKFPNIIFKYGRYVPNSEPRFDEVLGVTLASNNQYGEKIS